MGSDGIARVKGELMRVLLANLKFFYQCRGLWSIYFLVTSVLVFTGVGFRTHPFWGLLGDTEGIPFAWMGVICAVSLAVGAIVVDLQMGVISAPLSFCLPDYRIVLRKLVSLVGLVLSLLVLLIGYAMDSFTELSPLYLFGISLVAYFGTVSIGLASRYGVMGIALGAGILPMIGTLLDFERSSGVVPTTASTVVAILLGTGGAVAVWQWLGRPELFRRRCGRPWQGLSGVWDAAAREKYRWLLVSPRGRPAPDATIGRFLLDMMTKCEPGSTAKYVWGRLYTWLLPGAGGRLLIGSVGLLGPASVALAWYLRGEPLAIALMVVLPGAILYPSPLHSSLLVAGGRRERFLAAMGSIVILGTILSLSVILAFEIVTAVIGVHVFAEPLRPGYPKSLTGRETPLNLRLIVLLLSLFPISRLLEVKFGRKLVWVSTSQTALFFPVIWLVIWRRTWLLAIPLGYIALIFILSWVLCAYGVYRVAMGSDLVRH